MELKRSLAVPRWYFSVGEAPRRLAQNKSPQHPGWAVGLPQHRGRSILASVRRFVGADDAGAWRQR